MTKISRGLRNNNPGNIRLGSFRYRGERVQSGDTAFRQFESMEWGFPPKVTLSSAVQP